MDFVAGNKKIKDKGTKPKADTNNLNQLISLLDQILTLKRQDTMVLDGFQENIIKALKEEKEKYLKVESYKQAINALKLLKYIDKIDVKIIGDNILFSNKDCNDIFRLCFVGFAFNMALNSELMPNCRFTTFNYGERKRYVIDHLPRPTTQIVISDGKVVNPQYTIPVVLTLLEDLIDTAKNYEGNFMGLCQYFITKIQDPCVDIAIVCYLRSIIFEAPSDNTPPFVELKDISSEFYSKRANKRLLHDIPEFWWKVSNALISYIYLSEENLNPKIQGYPRIPDGLLLFPDIYFVREKEVIQYKIQPNYKPFIQRQRPIKQQKQPKV